MIWTVMGEDMVGTHITATQETDMVVDMAVMVVVVVVMEAMAAVMGAVMAVVMVVEDMVVVVVMEVMDLHLGAIETMVVVVMVEDMGVAMVGGTVVGGMVADTDDMTLMTNLVVSRMYWQMATHFSATYNILWIHLHDSRDY